MEKRCLALILALLVVVSVLIQPVSAKASSYEVVKQYNFELYDTDDSRVVYEYYATNGVSEINYQGNKLHAVELIKGLALQGETVTIRAKITIPLTVEQGIYLSNCDRVTANIRGTHDLAVYVEGYFSPDGKYFDSASAYSMVYFGTKENPYNGLVANSNREYQTSTVAVSVWPYSFEYMMPIESKDYEYVSVEYVFTLNNIAHNGLQFNLYWDDMEIDVMCDILSASSINDINSQITNNLINNKTDVIVNKQETIIQKQDTIIDKIQSGFASVGESVKTGVTNAVNELFVPDEQAVQDFFTNMNEMEEEHLKPIAQVKDTVNTIEQTLFNPDYDAQISGDLAPVAGYINTVQGDGVFIFPGYEMKLKEGNFPLWEDYVIDVGATLDDMGLSWIPTVTKAICVALFTWRFLIMVLRWLMKVTDNPTFGQWADMLATFDFNYKTGW